jgi:hypothetical protein
MTQHAELGASSSARWMNCAGSVPLSRPYEGRSSVYAAEGTVAHTLAAATLATTRRPPVGAVLEVDGHQIIVTDEMDDAVQVYVDLVSELRGKARWSAFEQKVTVHSVPPGAECYGTADFVALVADVLYVVDFKFGKGVIVAVENNSQAMFYALAASETFIRGTLTNTVREIKLQIVQPRIEGARVKTWEIDLIDLLMWRDSQLMPAVQRILDGDRSLTDGPWCRFCPALAVCPLKHELAQEAAKTAFVDDLPWLGLDLQQNNQDISPAIIADRLQLALRLEDWANALKEEATVLIHQGETVPGFKLVESRSNRKWTADDTAIAAEIARRAHLTGAQIDALYTEPELKSPAQMEKQFSRWRTSKQILDGLITKPPGKPALVIEADPRPPMKFMTAAEAFAQSAALEDEP